MNNPENIIKYADSFNLPYGITVNKNTDIGALTAIILSLISLCISVIVFFYTFTYSYEVEALLPTELIFVEFDSQTPIPKNSDVIRNITLSPAIINNGKKAATIISVDLLFQLDGKKCLYKWDDKIVSGFATNDVKKVEVLPFGLEPAKVVSDHYTFSIHSIEGKIHNKQPNYFTWSIELNQSHKLHFEVIYKLSDGNYISKSCDLAGSEFNGYLSARLIGVKGNKNRTQGGFGMKCDTVQDSL